VTIVKMSGIDRDLEQTAVHLIPNLILTQSGRYHRHHHKHNISYFTALILPLVDIKHELMYVVFKN
jgi:hypothetical protein